MATPNVDLNPESEQQRLQSEANVYALLARLWISELDVETVAKLQLDQLRDFFEQLGGFVPSGEANLQLVDELAIEYCGCFLGPKNHLPPHQSVVNQSRFQGKCVDSMNTFVRIVGRPQGDLFDQQKLVDHAGIQLSVMGTICETLAGCSDEDQASLVELKRSFFSNHLAWLVAYCDAAVVKTNSDFYRGLFLVSKAFLELRGISG